MKRDVAWARGGLASAVREAILSLVFRPLIAVYARRAVTGHEHLAAVTGPVVFVANHSSHMDTPLILRALPRSWRRRTAVAAAADYFYTRALLARAVALAFNTVPVARKGETPEPGETALDRVLSQGWSLLVFAEGTRSRDGNVGRLRSGAALLATAHDLPIVPVYVAGTHATMPVGQGWPRRAGRRRHPVRVAFGPAFRPAADEHRTEVMEHVRLFLASQGASTTPDKRAAAARTSSTA